MFLLTTLLLFIVSCTVSTPVLEAYSATHQFHHKLELLLTTERAILRQLEDIRPLIAGHEETVDFVDFLLFDSGYPALGGSPREVVRYPMDRFKLVERYLYDWPVLTEMLRVLEVEVDPGTLFSSSLPTLPSWGDLVRTVADLNTATAIYGGAGQDELGHQGHQDELGSSEDLAFNTGNYLVLTNISHSLGHVEACANWASVADVELITGDDPFVIPGEEHWLEQYLRYYECLVVEGREVDRAAEVRGEITDHYGAAEGHILDMIDEGHGKLESREAGITECAREPAKLESYCFVENHPHNPLLLIKVEKVHGHKITFYHDLVSAPPLLDRRPKGGAILIANTDSYPYIRIVTSSSGTLTLEPGAGVLVELGSVKTLCNPQHGISVIYSV